MLQRRQQVGAYNMLMDELRSDDIDMYEGFTRMSPEQFDELGSNSTWLDSTRLDSTHSTCRAHAFGCVELVEEHRSTRSTRRARQALYLQLSYDHRNSFIV